MTQNPTRVRIIHDSDAQDPRDWEDMCEIAAVERRRYTPAEQITRLITATKSWKAAMEMTWAAYNENEHGSLTESDMEEKLEFDPDFRDTWLEAVKGELLVETFYADQGCCGYVAHTTPEHCQRVGCDWDHAAKGMASSIETFKQWANGDVYGFVIEECLDVDDGDWVEVESCWGFDGTDWFTNGMSDYVPEELHDQLRNAEIEFKF